MAGRNHSESTNTGPWSRKTANKNRNGRGSSGTMNLLTLRTYERQGMRDKKEVTCFRANFQSLFLDFLDVTLVLHNLVAKWFHSPWCDRDVNRHPQSRCQVVQVVPLARDPTGTSPLPWGRSVPAPRGTPGTWSKSTEPVQRPKTSTSGTRDIE